jgi:phage terminase large subunit
MSAQEKRVNLGYRPRPLQQELHSSLNRFNVVVAHRRFGKTVFSTGEMIDKGLHLYQSRKIARPRYAYVAPDYGLAKRIAWDYFKSQLKDVPGYIPNENELRIDISLFGDETDTLRFQLWGAEKPDKLVGTYLDGVVLDEYGVMNPTTWTTAIRPQLSDLDRLKVHRPWALFIGTPRGKNSFYDLFKYAKDSGDPEWYQRVLKASETGYVDAAELASARRTMSEEEFLQEYECSFDAAIKGAYFAKLIADIESKGRIRPVHYDQQLGVMTAWDLGINDSLVIWFAQRLHTEIRIIDYLEMKDMPDGLHDVVRELKNKPYLFTTHFLPHDVAVRELTTGKSRLENLQKMGLKGIEVIPRLSLSDGLNAVKNMLPNCWFDSERCYQGIEHLRNYRREWDDKAQIFKDRPLHNEASHAADAFRQLALGIDKERPLVEPEREERGITEWDEFGGDFL